MITPACSPCCIDRGFKAVPPPNPGTRQGNSGRCILSQDVHTPGVIASVFLSETSGGNPLPLSAGRLPETLRMDEEDGRPGPGAWKSGPVDVLKDALMGSLCCPAPIPAQFTPFSRFAIARIPSDPSHNVIPHPSNPAPLFGRRPAEGVRPRAGEGEAA